MSVPRVRCAAACAAAIAIVASSDARAENVAPAPRAQEGPERDNTFVVGAGGAADLELADGALGVGANLFVEVEVLERWLELELGVSALASDGGVAVPIDLLVKKPFTLTPKLELMVGLGPTLTRMSGTARDGTFLGGEIALDVMYWATRHFGFYLEPTYELVFRGGAHHGAGTTGGAIFGF